MTRMVYEAVWRMKAMSSLFKIFMGRQTVTKYLITKKAFTSPFIKERL